MVTSAIILALFIVRWIRAGSFFEKYAMIMVSPQSVSVPVTGKVEMQQDFMMAALVSLTEAQNFSGNCECPVYAYLP